MCVNTLIPRLSLSHWATASVERTIEVLKNFVPVNMEEGEFLQTLRLSTEKQCESGRTRLGRSAIELHFRRKV